jgi:tRNA threonylcarbamoyladenosine biosynthesis protein TsaE
MAITHITSSPEETIALGDQLGGTLQAPAVLCFFGDLAAGKTTFIKGLAAGLGVGKELEVSSPTFTYLNIYPGKWPIYHFDLYRLQDADAFLSMGFDEYLFAEGICCIEWSEKIASLLPLDCLRITLAHMGENIRKITIHHDRI